MDHDADRWILIRRAAIATALLADDLLADYEAGRRDDRGRFLVPAGTAQRRLRFNAAVSRLQRLAGHV